MLYAVVEQTATKIACPESLSSQPPGRRKTSRDLHEVGNPSRAQRRTAADTALKTWIRVGQSPLPDIAIKLTIPIVTHNNVTCAPSKKLCKRCDSRDCVGSQMCCSI